MEDVKTLKDPLIWIDCEMTGLDVANDALIEVAVVVTDGDLSIVDPGMDVLITPPACALENMNDFVRNMHTSAGRHPGVHSGVGVLPPCPLPGAARANRQGASGRPRGRLAGNRPRRPRPVGSAELHGDGAAREAAPPRTRPLLRAQVSVAVPTCPQGRRDALKAGWALCFLG